MARDSILQEVSEIMQGILDVDNVVDDDNFFEIGGNSFMALSLIDIVHERFGVGITLIDLITTSTPAEISQLICERGQLARD